MFKKIFLAAILLIFFIAGAFILLKKENNNRSAEKSILINGYKFKMEMADTENERAQGLSGRQSLCSECAMLFVFDKKDTHSFWMKNMKFDLDMFWISGDEIMQIDESVPAEKSINETRISKFPIDKVLEVNAGTSDKIGVKVGDKVKF